jgi:hypothetical protein
VSIPLGEALLALIIGYLCTSCLYCCISDYIVVPLYLIDLICVSDLYIHVSHVYAVNTCKYLAFYCNSLQLVVWGV